MKKTRVTLLCLLLQIVAMLPCLAQGKWADQESMNREAYAYRDDISPELMEKIKALPSSAKLHSTWIEIRRGKSLWTDGSEMFPDVAYQHITHPYPRIYELTNRGKSGLWHDDGTCIVPMEYKRIIISDDGLVKCEKEPVEEGKNKFRRGFDVFTINGTKLLGSSYLSKDKYSTFYCIPDTIKKIIRVEYRAPNGKDKMVQLHYLDGQLMFGPVECKDSYLKVDATGSVSGGAKGQIVDYNPQAHPSLVPESKFNAAMVSTLYKSNIWIEKALACYNNKDWAGALRMMDYFDHYDYFLRFQGSDESTAFALMWLQCKYEQGAYEDIFSVVEQGHMGRYGLLYDKTKGALRNLVLPTERQKALHEQCQTIFADAAAPYIAAALEAERQARREREERNAQIVAAIFGAVSNSLNTILSYASSGSGSSTKVVGTKSSSVKAGSTAASSAAGEEPQESLVTVEKQIECKVCKGSGVCTYCNGSGHGTKLGYDVTCGACGGHPKCSSCRGRGYNVRYTTERK